MFSEGKSETFIVPQCFTCCGINLKTTGASSRTPAGPWAPGLEPQTEINKLRSGFGYFLVVIVLFTSRQTGSAAGRLDQQQADWISSR